MSTTHGPEALRAFQKGETRLVWAVDADLGNEVVRFPEGMTQKADQEAFRERARRSLRCIVPTCRAPLTPHFRTVRQPGFAHERGTSSQGHAESVAHEMAKYAIAEWAEARYPRMVTAAVEQASLDGSRRPDVTLLSAASGARIAVEVQYSGMTVRELQERLSDHAADGYQAEVWLLGHLGPNRPAGRAPGVVRINELARALTRAGVTPVWFHPGTRKVLTAWSTPDEHGPRPLQGTGTSLFEIASLKECELDERGLVTPAIRKLRAAQSARDRAARKAAERAAQFLAEQQAAAARLLAEQQAAELELKRTQDRRIESWNGSSERAWLLERHPDALPARLVQTDDAERELAERLDMTPEHWKAVVYMQMASAVDNVLTWKQLCGAVTRHRRRNLDQEHWRTLQETARGVARDGLVHGSWRNGEFVSSQIQRARHIAQLRLMQTTARPPVVAEPISTEPASVEPATTETIETQPATVEPAQTTPVATATRESVRPPATEANRDVPCVVEPQPPAKSIEPRRSLWRRLLGR